MPYDVRVNGQVIGTLDRIDIEKRSDRWKKLGVTVEVREASTGAYSALAEFLAGRTPVKRISHPVVPANSDMYQVSVRRQVIAPPDGGRQHP